MTRRQDKHLEKCLQRWNSHVFPQPSVSPPARSKTLNHRHVCCAPRAGCEEALIGSTAELRWWHPTVTGWGPCALGTRSPKPSLLTRCSAPLCSSSSGLLRVPKFRRFHQEVLTVTLIDGAQQTVLNCINGGRKRDVCKLGLHCSESQRLSPSIQTGAAQLCQWRSQKRCLQAGSALFTTQAWGMGRSAAPAMFS